MELSSEDPTAIQLVGLAQETLESSLYGALVFGLGTVDQVVPFHNSVSVWDHGEPTAMQLRAVAHETEE
jgi:hypothetical protein